VHTPPRDRTVDQIIGTSWFDYYPQDQHATLRAAMARMLASGDPTEFGGQAMRTEGTIGWYAARRGPVKEAGKIVGAVVIARDVSDKKQTEMQLMLADRMAFGPTGPAINVRVAPAGPGRLLADTLGLPVLGLPVLGLPDLQVVFTDQDPAEVAFQLLSNARRVFVGDSLDVGWIEESSLYPPLRNALTLQP
jgi:PAS fold